MLVFSMESRVSVIELECPLDNVRWEGLALAAVPSLLNNPSAKVKSRRTSPQLEC